MSDEEILDRQVPVRDEPSPLVIPRDVVVDVTEPSAEQLVALRRRDPLYPAPVLVGVAAG